MKNVTDEPRVEVCGDRRQLGLAAIGCIGAAVGIVYLGYFVPAVNLAPFIVWLCASSLALMGLIAAARVVSAARPFIVVDEKGFRDRRLFDGVLLWADVREAGVTALGRNRYLAFRVEPEVKKELGLHLTFRAMELTNVGGRKDLLQSNTFGLKTDIQTLMGQCFLAASRGGVPLQPMTGTAPVPERS